MSDFSCYGGPSDEWLAVEKTLPAPSNLDQPLAERKRLVNEGREAVAAKDMRDLGPQVLMQTYKIPTRDGGSIEARSYRSKSVNSTSALPIYIHLHGGGYLFGTLASEDAICARIALGAEVVVFNINYRHTPEYAYPTAWDDVEDAFEWVHASIDEIGGDGQRLVIGGISAGAHIAASLVLKKHLDKNNSLPRIVGQVLMIPCVANLYCYGPQLKKLKDSVSSYRENEHAPTLPLTTAKMFTDLLKVKDPKDTDTMLNPGNATPSQVEGLPPTTFGIAGLDPLRDEGLLFAKMLAEAGVATNVNLFKGVPHGFRRFGDRLSASARWDMVMEDGIRWALTRPSGSNNFVVKT
ncbi:hypothetical protein G7046_g7814 [Stylonectria norvegica]|nr:hypothetical protein G7046_g7814 [Stylonectria norvegica]